MSEGLIQGGFGEASVFEQEFAPDSDQPQIIDTALNTMLQDLSSDEIATHVETCDDPVVADQARRIIQSRFYDSKDPNEHTDAANRIWLVINKYKLDKTE